MNTTAFKLGALALIAVLLVSLIPYVGAFVIAPLVALAMSAAAGRRAAAMAPHGAPNQAAKAGVFVGVGALIGSIVGLTILVVFLVDIPAVQEYIRASEPNPEARIPYESMVPIGAVMGSVVGFLVGLFDLFVAIVGGLFAGWIYDHNRKLSA